VSGTKRFSLGNTHNGLSNFLSISFCRSSPGEASVRAAAEERPPHQWPRRQDDSLPWAVSTSKEPEQLQVKRKHSQKPTHSRTYRSPPQTPRRPNRTFPLAPRHQLPRQRRPPSPTFHLGAPPHHPFSPRFLPMDLVLGSAPQIVMMHPFRLAPLLSNRALLRVQKPCFHLLLRIPNPVDLSHQK
jgi:hypothetical protein